MTAKALDLTQDHLNPSHLSYLSYAARDLPTPKFRDAVEVRGPSSRAVRCIAYSLDGKRLATGHEKSSLRIWDVRDKMDPNKTVQLPSSGNSPHVGHVGAIAWSPAERDGGRVLASGCKVAPKQSKVLAVLCIWDIDAPKAPIFSYNLPSDCYSITYHPSGDHISVVCQRGNEDEALFFSRRTGEDGQPVWGYRDDVGLGGEGADMMMEELNNFRFSNSGKFLMAVSDDGSISAWAYPTETQIHHLPIDAAADASATNGDANAEAGPSSPRAGSAAPSRTGSPGPDGTNGGGDVDMEGEQVDEEDEDDEESKAAKAKEAAKATIPEPQMPSNRKPVVQTVSKKALAAAKAKAEAKERQEIRQKQLVRARQLKRIKHSIVYSAHLLAMGLCPTGKFVAVGGQDALLSLYTMRDWICVRTFDCVVSVIRHIAFSPDGEFIAVGGDDKFVYIVSVYSGQVVHKSKHNGESVMSLAWHPQHNWLAYSLKYGSSTASPPVVWYLVRQE